MVNRVLDHLEEWLITFLIGAATLIIFVAVLHRYATGFADPAVSRMLLLKIDMSWAQELCIFMFVWMAKFGAAYGVRTGIHVGVDVLINALKPNVRAKFIIFGLLGGALFTGIIGSFGAHFVWELMHTEQVSADLELPKWIVYAVHPARFLPDVLPLPAGVAGASSRPAICRTRPCARRGPRQGRRDRWAKLPSDLHPKDEPDGPGSTQ